MNLAPLASEMDLEATMDRLCGDTALLIEILDLFVAEFISESSNIQNHIHGADYGWVSSKAHYLKGIAQNLALLTFLREIQQLEQSAKQLDQAGCIQTLNALGQTVQRIHALRSSIQAA
jgi:HPt (histidine-containing phosphotransfer) domain-containing protein